MEDRIKSIIGQGDQLFSKRLTLMSLWQNIADNFYPERADFTVSRTLGTEFADNLMTSYPLLVRRDLGNSLGAMLRPSSKDWFSISTDQPDNIDAAGKQWLEWASNTQRRAMYDRASQYVRASKEADHDFATFGQYVKSFELNKTASGMLYRCWHLRDVAWCEDSEGKIGAVHRKWKPSAQVLKAVFGDRIAPKVQEALAKNPYEEFECRHIVIKADDYEAALGQRWKTPYVSLYIDVANGHVMEEIGTYNKFYNIPRWQTVSGSQYAYSPATVAALPDARLLQSMTAVLLEAGEKAVTPPMLATQEAIRSDINLRAGGLTWVDSAYDERLGEVLRPISSDKNGIPLGMELRADVRATIAEAFYINKLTLPTFDHAMTATEAAQRVQEYIRQALPIFEPMEEEANGGDCEGTFDLMLRAGAFGSPQDIPESLQGQNIQFKFQSPLRDAIESQKGQKFLEAKEILREAAELDPGSLAQIDVQMALRDALGGIGVPAKWLRSEQDVADILAAQQEQQDQQAQMESVHQGAMVTEQAAKADRAMAEA